MIFNSYEWKKDLLKIAHKLGERQTQKKWTERSRVNLEKDIFIAFYSIRKLIEAKKLSDKCLDMKLKGYSFSSTGKEVHFLNWHKIDDLFNLESPKKEQLGLNFVCNQIIHSYVFLSSENIDGGLESILFCSDRKKEINLYQLEIPQITKCFSTIFNDTKDTLSL